MNKEIYMVKPMRTLTGGKQLYKVIKGIPMSDSAQKRTKYRAVIVQDNLPLSVALERKNRLNGEA